MTKDCLFFLIRCISEDTLDKSSRLKWQETIELEVVDSAAFLVIFQASLLSNSNWHFNSKWSFCGGHVGGFQPWNSEFNYLWVQRSLFNLSPFVMLSSVFVRFNQVSKDWKSGRSKINGLWEWTDMFWRVCSTCDVLKNHVRSLNKSISTPVIQFVGTSFFEIASYPRG